MPEVSADVHVPIPPDRARAMAGRQPPVRHTVAVLRRFQEGWRFDPEGDGTRVVRRYRYELVGPAWARRVGAVAGQWWLGREVERRLDVFAAACAQEQARGALTTEEATRA